jgi:hypothetical protein
MEDKTARAIQAYGTLALIILTAGLLLSDYIPYLRVAAAPQYTPYLAVLFIVFAAILGYLTFPTKRVTEFFERRRAENAAAPPDLTHELLADLATTKKVWLTDSSYVDSFGYATLNLLNEANQQAAASKTLSPFIQEANGAINGWRCQRPTQQFLVTQLDTLAEFGVGMNAGTLVATLDALGSVALSGAQTANYFVQAISNGQVPASKFAKQQWNSFANKANRLSDDLTKLGEKVHVATGVDLKLYIPQVNSL